MFFILFLYQRRLCADQRFMPASLNRKPFVWRSIVEELAVGPYAATSSPPVTNPAIMALKWQKPCQQG
jgi:hypothetical protein